MPAASRFRIGNLTLDTGRRLLLCDSKPVPLGPLTYRLLLTLLEAAPNVVSHDELVKSIWAGRLVSPETISQRIKLLRDALSDDPHHPRYIELVRGQGYRLLPPVEPLPNDPPPRARTVRVTAIGAGIVVAMIGAVAFWMLQRPTGTVTESPSIAVLPFADLSPGRDQQYFADGMAEEILNILSKGTTLRVIARTSSFSFRGEETDVRRIAKALDVSHVLEGSVRKAGDSIRVTVRLVDASDGSRVWSESYDQQLGNILALQTDVARSVAAALEAKLPSDVPEATARHVNAEAYDAYLRGQQKLRAQALKEAAGYFEQAIAIDPEFIPGYHGLGTAYVWQVVDTWISVDEARAKLREILSRALPLAPDDPGLIALSGQLARYDNDVKLAEERFLTAQQRDPANAVLQLVYPNFRLDQNRPTEALRLVRRSLEFDPMNPILYIAIWACHMDRWEPEQALAAAAHYRELAAPSDTSQDDMTALTKLVVLGDLVGSVEAWSAKATARTFNYFWLSMPYYFVEDLQTADALVELRRPRTPNSPATNNPARIALAAYRQLVLGDVDEARRLALSALLLPDKRWVGHDTDVILVRLAFDAMLANGEARRAVDFLEKLAPHYARYRATAHIDPKDFSPAPVPVKSAFHTFSALYFADYSRALRAAGDEMGANRMLDHLDANLALRRKDELLIEERHVAEALALRGRTDAALDALEKAERDRTIYYRWHLVLLHNEIFAGFRSHPRFVALVEKVRRDVARQRDELRRLNLSPRPSPAPESPAPSR